MKIKVRQTRLPFTEEERRGFYERVKNSARVHRNRKKFYRPDNKKEEQ